MADTKLQVINFRINQAPQINKIVLTNTHPTNNEIIRFAQITNFCSRFTRDFAEGVSSILTGASIGPLGPATSNRNKIIIDIISAIVLFLLTIKNGEHHKVEISLFSS